MSWRPSAQKPKRTVRDFHRRRYGNPLFPRSSSVARPRSASGRREPGTGIAILPGLTAVFGVALFAYLLWGPALTVRTIEIVGATLPATEDTVRTALEDYADKPALGIFPRRNLFIFSIGGAHAAVDGKVFLESIEIDKRLPSTITVTIAEKTPKAVLEREGRLYALDANGFLVRELAESEMAEMKDLPPGVSVVTTVGLGAETVDLAAPVADTPPAEPAPRPTNILPLILDRVEEGASPLRPGAQAASSSTIAIILEAYGRLPDIIGDTVRWFEKGEDGKSVDVTVGADWKILLSTALPFDAQAERLGVVLKEKIGARAADLDYVDLRYNEKIYFRMKGGGETP